MPEIFKQELWVKDITDIAKVVTNANPKKNKSLVRSRTITISDGDTEIIVKNTPEALTGFVLGGITVTFSISQTSMADFGNGEGGDTEEDDLEEIDK